MTQDDFELPDDILECAKLASEFPTLRTHMVSDQGKMDEAFVVICNMALALFRSAQLGHEKYVESLQHDISMMLYYIYSRGWFRRHYDAGDMVSDNEKFEQNMKKLFELED